MEKEIMLMNLIVEGGARADEVCDASENCRECSYKEGICRYQIIAEYLASHGVTVQTANPIEIDGVSHWIPVTERLPELCVPVIVCRDDGKVEQGVYFTSNGWWKVFGARTKRVTHWQPLPEPPKGGLI